MNAYQIALKAVGGLSRPSKMPCKSYSTPPRLTCTVGSKLAVDKSTICGHCYARKGNYVFPNVDAAMKRREKIVRKAMANPDLKNKWIGHMVIIMIHRYNETIKRVRSNRTIRDDGRYFRWHDAGDLISESHLDAINMVAAHVPFVNFWLPTKEIGIVIKFLKDIEPAKNLMIRLSLPRPDTNSAMMPKPYMRLINTPNVAFTGTHTTEYSEGFNTCPAWKNDNKCGSCRECWSNSYISHGVH